MAAGGKTAPNYCTRPGGGRVFSLCAKTKSKCLGTPLNPYGCRLCGNSPIFSVQAHPTIQLLKVQHQARIMAKTRKTFNEICNDLKRERTQVVFAVEEYLVDDTWSDIVGDEYVLLMGVCHIAFTKEKAQAWIAEHGDKERDYRIREWAVDNEEIT